MELSVKQRLVAYLDYKKISKAEFGRRIGASSAFVTSIRSSISDGKIKSIALQFPDLNRDWLLYGEGEMLKPLSTKQCSLSQQGDHNTQVSGVGNTVSTPTTVDNFLKEIAEQRKLVARAQEIAAESQAQVSRLITIIEHYQK